MTVPLLRCARGPPCAHLVYEAPDYDKPTKPPLRCQLKPGRCGYQRKVPK